MSQQRGNSPPISLPYLVVAAGISLAICYATVVVSLVTLWSTYALYSFGFAVPVIAGWLCWRRSQSSRQIRWVPDYVFGVPLILASLGLLLVGRVGTIETLAQTSLLVALAGFVLVFFGRETLITYRVPFAYLSFMVPIWNVVLKHLQDPSRLISARIATAFLELANVPVFRHDAILTLSSATLSVMPQCSGVNQLVAILAMVLPASYVLIDGNIRRLTLVSFSVVIGYVSNGFRIALVGWLATNGLGTGDLAASYTHVTEGLLVSAGGYAIIIALLYWLARYNQISAPKILLPQTEPQPASASRQPALDFAVIAILIVTGILPLMAMSREVNPGRDLRSLPKTVGVWKAADAPPLTRPWSGVSEELVDAYPTPAGVRSFAGVDDEISRLYENPSSLPLRLYVGYYRRQQEGRELAGDTGQILAAAATPMVLINGSQNVIAREVVRTDSNGQRGLLYWYYIDGHAVSDTYLAKVYTIWNGLVHQRTNGAVVMITWDRLPISIGDARTQAQAFARDLLPVLSGYFDRFQG